MNPKDNITTQKFSLPNQISIINMPAVQISVIPKAPASLNSSTNNNNNNNTTRSDNVGVNQNTATLTIATTIATTTTTANTTAIGGNIKNSAASASVANNKISILPNSSNFTKTDLYLFGKVINPSMATITPLNIFNAKFPSKKITIPSISTTKGNAILLTNTNTAVITPICNAQSQQQQQQQQPQRTGILLAKPLPTYMNKNIVKHIVIGGVGNSGINRISTANINNTKIQLPIYSKTFIGENKNNTAAAAACHTSSAVKIIDNVGIMSSTVPPTVAITLPQLVVKTTPVATTATITSISETHNKIITKNNNINSNQDNFSQETHFVSSTKDNCLEYFKIQNIPKSSGIIKSIKPSMATAQAVVTSHPIKHKQICELEQDNNTTTTTTTTTNIKDKDNMEEIDNVENLRKWSEALAKKQTVQISDSVILSVAKSNNNNNNNNINNKNNLTSNPQAASNDNSNILKTYTNILPNQTAVITTTQNNNTNNKMIMEKVFPLQQSKVVLLADKNKIDIKQVSLLRAKQENPIEMPKSIPMSKEIQRKQEQEDEKTDKIGEQNIIETKVHDIENEIKLLTVMSNKFKRSLSVEEENSISKITMSVQPERRHSISSINDKSFDEIIINDKKNITNEMECEEFENSNNDISEIKDNSMESDDFNDSVLIIEEEEEEKSEEEEEENDDKFIVKELQEKEKEKPYVIKSPLKLSTLSAAMVEQKQNLLPNNNNNNNDNISKTTCEASVQKIVQKQSSAPSVTLPLVASTTTIAAINLDSDEELTNDYKMDTLEEPSTATTKTHENLMCDEKILLNTSSSSSINSNKPTIEQKSPKEKRHNNNNNNTMKSTTGNSATVTRVTATEETPIMADFDTYSSTLDILSTFNMLTWRERVGSARGSNVRFQLNEFNLIQVYERVKPRISVPAIFERPILKRDDALNTKLRSGQVVLDPFLYLCRRCCCHGPATEFLAPEFCSLECLKQRAGNTRKRTHAEANAASKELQVTQKRSRTVPMPQNLSPPSLSSNNNNNSLLDPNGGSNLPTFQWVKYLKNSSCAAPINLFPNPFPTGPNRFEIDMKLEAIDPENCSLCCVCTVVKIAGYRLKLSFDGYDSMYDFWVNADSMDIFPPGWCQKTSRLLQPPLGIVAEEFNWHTYLAKSRCTPAPRTLFTHLNAATMPSRNPFKIGMYLEAEDLNDTGKLCVATVADVLNDRLRIHFDGWEDCYDYWVDTNSPYIHPVGWHEGRQTLVPPQSYAYGSFSWTEYLRRVGGVPAPSEYFSARDPIEFKPNMKLEVVDPRIPDFIRPATVTARKGHRIKVHLDLWLPSYCFWLEDDSPDIHPIGWCDATGHELEAPPGYKMRHYRNHSSQSHFVGCRNVGNAKNYQFQNHFTLDECPYALQNWRYKPQKPRRVQSELIVVNGKTATVHPTPSSSSSLASSFNKSTLNNNQIIIEPSTTKAATLTTTATTNKKTVKSHQNIDNSDTKRAIAGAGTGSKANVDIASNKKKSNTEINQKIKKEIEMDEECINKIAKEFLCDYGPRLKQSQELWQKHLSISNVTLNETIVSNPLSWSATDVATFVERILKSNTAATAFLKEDIDGGSFLQLRQSDITDMLNLPLGPSLKLYAHLLNLRAICMCKFQGKNSPFKY